MVDWRATTFTEGQWKKLRQVAIAIVYCGVRTGCTASLGALLDVVNGKNTPNPTEIVSSKRTLQRLLREGGTFGLLHSEKQSSSVGNAPAYRWVDEATVDALLELSRGFDKKTPSKPERNEPSGTHLASTWHSPDTHRPYTTTSLTKKTNSSLRSSDDQKNAWTKDEIYGIRALADRLERKLGGTRKRCDRDLICKACYLAYCSKVFSEDWLHDSIEGVLRSARGNRWQALHGFLANKASDVRKNFNQELARISVPDELFQRTATNADERLCVGGDE